MGTNEIVSYERDEIVYENLSEKFKLTGRNFNRQYAHIYAVRLMKFRTLLEDRVSRKWGDNTP